MKFASGSTYEGLWKDGKKIKGRVDFSDGGQHWASYENDQICGPYKRKYHPSGTILEGNVSNGKVNGPGTYTFISGTIWKGTFFNDLLQGSGTETKKDGTVSQVTFKDNKVDKRH